MSEFSFDQVASQRLWTVAVEQLRSKIESGEIPVGSRLPSERVLCSELGISRVSLREALRVLQATGYVQTRQGAGTFARLPEEREQATSLWFANDLHVIELLEMRIVIEPGVAAFAARRRTDDDLVAMECAVSDMRRAAELDDRLMVVAADAEFHRVIGLSVRNAALGDLMEQFQEQSGMERRASLSVPGQTQRALDGHQAILDAIRSADAVLARKAMQSHLEDAMHITHEYAETISQSKEKKK